MAERYGVAPHVRFDTELLAAEWDEEAARWRLETSQGDMSAEVLVLGQGPLSEPRLPELPGLDSFAGATFHSARWDHDHDLSGERVAVIGTGASAIQFVPQIQPRAERLHVFQRTPPWVVPRGNRELTPLERRVYRRLPAAQLAMRAGIYWARESLVLGLRYRAAGRLLERIALKHLERQVPDPALRERLRPSYAVGCKRILPADDWYPTLTQPNVEVVTDLIREVRPHSIVTADGQERAVDTIVFGTGFYVTDVAVAGRVRGRAGATLAETWNGTPRAYKGAAVAGFPNMFLLVGPNTGLGHNSIVFMIEAQVNYVAGALRELHRNGARSVEVLPAAEAAYNAEVQRMTRGTVWVTGGCASWYIDRNGVNSTLWPTFTWPFRQRTREFDAAAYATA